MTTSALILRDPAAPPIHVLEVDGPRHFVEVNRFPQNNVSFFMEFEEFEQLPDHFKYPAPSGGDHEWNTAVRVFRVLKNARETRNITLAQLDELNWRMEILFPGIHHSI